MSLAQIFYEMDYFDHLLKEHNFFGGEVCTDDGGVDGVAVDVFGGDADLLEEATLIGK